MTINSITAAATAALITYFRKRESKFIANFDAFHKTKFPIFEIIAALLIIY